MDKSSLQRRNLSGAATRRSFRKSFFALALGASYGMFCAGQAGALPGTPTIQNNGPPGNNATFASTATTLTVTQLTQNLGIVWTPSGTGSTPTKAFDILSGETVTFVQPLTTSVAYNAISCPNCSATQIAGTLQSQLAGAPAGTVGGRVWLFDPNGIVIGQGAVVNVGGFVASTLQGNIANWVQHPNNPLTLDDGGGTTPTNGAVTNDGNITAKDGVLGYVALIGNSVAATHTGATGSIDVGFGSINLAAGRVATITALNTGGLNFALSTAAGDAINVNNGGATSAVANSGALTGAAVTLSANVANALFASAVNTSGVIRAVNLDNSGGTITLTGAGSPVVASGTLDASGNTGADPVGTVQITGDSVSLGASTIHGTLTATSVTGDITETGAVTADAGGTFTSAGNINLGTQANDLKNPAFVFTGGTGNLGYRDINAIAMPPITVPGSITLISDTGTITQTGTIAATAGSFTTSAANQAITLSDAGNTFTGAVSLNTTGTGTATIEAAALNFGASNVGGTLTGTATTGGITEGAAITAGGGSFTTQTANQSINLAQTNNFAGAVSLNTTGTGTATIKAGTLNLGTSTVGGALTATSTAGDITESGVLNAATGSSFTSAGNTNLGTQANVLPAPTFAFTGSTGNLALREAGAIAMPTIIVPGSITLISDTGTITQTLGSTITATAGNFTTSTANQAITLGNAGNTFTGAVSLNTTGTGTATIEAGTLNLGTSTVGGALTATSTAGDITESGVLTAATGSSFTSAGNINLGTQANVLPAPTFAFTGTTGNLGLREAAAIAMPTIIVPGSITLISDTGTITQTLGSTITATAGNFTTSTANQAITLGNAGNTFTGAVSLNTTGTGTATIEAGTLNLGTSTVGGALTATSTAGDITESGVLTAATGSSFTSAGNINLGTQANVLPAPTFAFTGTTGNLGLREAAAIAMPTIIVPGSITLISDTGTITQTLGSTITATAGNFTTSTANQAITLGNAGNTFTGAVSLNTTGTGTATIEAGTLNLGTSTVGGALTATSTAGDITESGVLTAATGSSFTSAGNINLGTQANDLKNPAFVFTGGTGNLGYRDINSIVMPATNLLGGSITLISDTGTITQTGPINAAAGNFTTTALNQGITLADAGNTFSGLVSLTTHGTGAATIEAAALNFGTSTVGGALTATSLTGDITETGGAVSAGAGSSFTSAGNINLATQANNFTGPVSLNTSGTGAASISSASLNLGTSNVGGPLTATSTSGAITESGVLTDASTSAFTSASTIDLSTQTNSLTGAVALNSVGNAAVKSTSLNFAASNVGGVLSGTATTGGLIQSGALTASGGNFTTSGTQTITLANAGNVFSGPVTLNTGTGAATIEAAALNLGASIVGGPLTVTTITGDITESGPLIDLVSSNFTSAHNIDLSTQPNQLSNPTFTFTGTTGNLGLRELAAISLSTINVPGSITLVSDTGSISQTGAFNATAGNFTTSGTQTITLTNAGNAFGGPVTLNTGTGAASISSASLNLGTSNVGGALTATSTSGAITESGVLTDASTSAFTSATTIDLSTQTNGLTGAVALNSAGSAAVKSTSLNFAASNVGGVLSGTATTGGLIQSGALTASGGNFTTSGTQTITLTNAGNAFGGPVTLNTGTGAASISSASLNLGTSNVGGALTATSTSGAITESGVLTDASTSAFTSATTIDLSTQTNGLTGAVALNSAGSAAVKSTSLNFAASNVGGVLTGTAATGGISESGGLTAAGGNFSALTANQGINLATQANNFTGPVSLNTSGTGAASIRSASLNLGASNVGGALTATSTSGAITESGVLTDASTSAFTSATTIDLSTQTNGLTGAVALNSAGNAAVKSTSLNLGASLVAGNLTATSTAGDITQSGVLSAPNASFSSAGNIDLSTQPNQLPNPTFTFTGTTGNLGLRELAAISLSTINVPGSITLVSDTGSISQTGAFNATAGNFTTSGTQTITLANAGNVFSGPVTLNTGTGAASISSASLNLGTSNVGGALTATSTSGAITESGVLTDASTSAFTSATTIDLSTQTNGLTGAVALNSAGNAAVKSTSLNFAASNVGGVLTGTAATGGVSEIGVLTAAGGSFSALTANQGINLATQANNFTGPVSLNTSGTGAASISSASLNLGTSNVGGTLTATSTSGAITESGVLTDASTSSFTSATTIDLSTQTNSLTGAVALNSAGSAAVTSTSLNFAASNVGGVLTGTATTGGIIESGVLTAAGGNFSALAANQAINLSTQANNFTGAVSLNTTGTGAASINSASLNLGTSSVGGALSATTTVGDITQSGILTDAAGGSFTSAGNINLATSTNALTGPVSLNAPGNAAIASSSLILAASTVGGTLAATSSTGDITETGVLSAPTSAFTSAGNIDLSTQANILPSVAFALTGASGNLAFQNAGNINLAATVPGSITLISDTGSITQTGAISATAGSFTTSGSQSITLANAGNLFSGPVTLNTGTGAATIESGALNLGASNVGGVLTGTAVTGAVTESGVLTAGGGNFSALTANQGINLATQANNFTGPVSLNTSGTGAASINSASLNLGTSSVGGPLTATSTVGNITQSGVLTDAAASSFTSAANIDLSTSTNVLTGPVALNSVGNAAITSTSLNFAASTVAGTLTATSTVGDIIESGILDPTASHFTSAGNINLATQPNVLPNATFTFTGATGNLGLREVASIVMPAITVPGSITLISDTGSITQSGAIAATAGNFTTSAANQAITLGNAGNVFTGPVSLNTSGSGAATILAGTLNLGASTVGGPLTATSTTGAITESGVLADASGSSFTSASTIDLSTSSNTLGGVVVLNSAGKAAISSSSLNFGASTVGGALTATATTGGITESGVVTAAGGTFSAATANQDVNLATQTNNFTGAVSLNTKGTGNAAIKATSLNLGASTVGGTLAATSTTGSITESGILTATGGSTFTSAGNIDLSTSTNVLGGTVTAVATNGFVNLKATQFAAVNAEAKNDITLNATAGDMDHVSAQTLAGNINATATGNMTLDGADAGLTSATGNVTLSAGGSISQTFAYNATAHTGLTSNDISIRGNTVTLTAPNLGSAGNFVGIIANNLTTANSTPGNLYFAVLTPSGQKIPPANLKINGLSALPVTPGVFLAVGNSLPQTPFNIGSPAYLSFVKAFQPAGTFDLSAGQVETSAESLASALNVAANSQQGTSSVNGILGSTPDANISLFNIVGVCLPADQRDDEEAAKQKDCVPAKSTDNRSPKLNPLSDALSSILVASRSVGSAAAQGLR